MIIILLAAGRGNRLEKSTPKEFNYITKSLVQFNSESAINRLIKQVNTISNKPLYIVVGHKYKEIIDDINKNSIYKMNIEFVVNKEFNNDSNLISLYLAINKILNIGENLDEGILIIEADSVFDDSDLKNLKNYIKINHKEYSSKKLIYWTTKGLSKSNDKGGFIDTKIENSYSKDGFISNVYISSSRNHQNSLKMYGITWMNRNAIFNWFEKSLDIFKNKSKNSNKYFHEVIFENRKDFTMRYYDLGEKVLSFNNYDEYISCLRLLSKNN